MYVCTCCGDKLEFIISLGIQPLANKYPIEIIEFNVEYKQELKIYNCNNCGYCYLPCSASRELFFQDYYYLSSVNKELVNHFEELAKELSKLSPKLVLDIGSNDGILLKPLKQLGINSIGVDPSENVGALANSNNLTTYIGFFDKKMADKIINDVGKPDVIVASSVFTHLEDPNQFLENCKKIISDNGILIIEIEFLNEIIESLGFERFYYDRPHYYTVESIGYLAQKVGFEIVSVSNINTHGGSLRLVLSRSKNNKFIQNLNNNRNYIKFSKEEIIENFNKFTIECEFLKQKLLEFKLNNSLVGAYGCPARFSTITNYCDIDEILIPYVIDDSPLKHGKYSPGKHIPIINYEKSKNVDILIVFAFEYLNSIKQRINSSKILYYRPIPFRLI